MTECLFDEVRYYLRGLKYPKGRWTYVEGRSKDELSREKYSWADKVANLQ